MTSDGVDGTAADRRVEAGCGTRTRRHPFIKRDDGWLGQRYIEPAYPHTPAGASPNCFRRERQVASALRNHTKRVIANSTDRTLWDRVLSRRSGTSADGLR